MGQCRNGAGITWIETVHGSVFSRPLLVVTVAEPGAVLSRPLLVVTVAVL